MTFYISKFRYKLGFAFIVGVIIIFINGNLMDMQLHVVLHDYGGTIVILFILGVWLWYPAFKYAFSNPKEMWEHWGYLGRQKRKKEFADFKFDRVYTKTHYAVAKEPKKGYRTMTTLESCTCPEFRKNHTPCKHMYKLADTLGLYRQE